MMYKKAEFELDPWLDW